MNCMVRKNKKYFATHYQFLIPFGNLQKDLLHSILFNIGSRDFKTLSNSNPILGTYISPLIVIFIFCIAV